MSSNSEGHLLRASATGVPETVIRTAEPDGWASQPADFETEICREIMDFLPAAIYTTDSEGRITYVNQAAISLAGRAPELGKDQWCVSWKLYRPDGSPLP